MSHTLMAVLGTLMVDGELRSSLIDSDRDQRLRTLKDRGFFLTRAEYATFENMMVTVASPDMDKICAQMRSFCPDWPCSFYTMA
jgi:hypothetical protein